jgi:hypothetical protein
VLLVNDTCNLWERKEKLPKFLAIKKKEISTY